MTLDDAFMEQMAERYRIGTILGEDVAEDENGLFVAKEEADGSYTLLYHAATELEATAARYALLTMVHTYRHDASTTVRYEVDFFDHRVTAAFLEFITEYKEQLEDMVDLIAPVRAGLA